MSRRINQLQPNLEHSTPWPIPSAPHRNFTTNLSTRHKPRLCFSPSAPSATPYEQDTLGQPPLLPQWQSETRQSPINAKHVAKQSMSRMSCASSWFVGRKLYLDSLPMYSIYSCTLGVMPTGFCMQPSHKDNKSTRFSPRISVLDRVKRGKKQPSCYTYLIKAHSLN